MLPFDDYELARDLGILALALILYEGGLTTDTDELRPVVLPALSLSFIGTLLTALIAGAAAASLFGLPLLEGLLLGSIIASTDVAAIFALLRGSGLQTRLSRLLEGEAGSNDPVAILLVIGFIEWIMQPGYGVADMGLLLAQQLGIGVAVGAAVATLAPRALRAIELPTVGLYPVASLTVGLIAFGATDVLGGSGFLAIYVTGLGLSAADIPARRTITAFHDGLAWLAQLAMFLTLGLLVFPTQLASIAVEGTVLALVLMFVARPIASLVATALTPLSVGERIVLGWAGLRGAVPVVLATFPVIAGVPDSLEFFNIIFFAVVLSLLAQGTTFVALAERLGLTTDDAPAATPLVELGAIRSLGADIVEFMVLEPDAAAGAHIRDLGLPRDAVVSVLIRGDDAVAPRGSTRIAAGDRLIVLVRREVAAEVDALVQRWRTGPLVPPPRPRRRTASGSPIFTVMPFREGAIEGDPQHPNAVRGEAVAARLRVRHDVPGSLAALADGRYAVIGPLLAMGSRPDVTDWARRRLVFADVAERAWLQTVIGALAVDVFAPDRSGRDQNPNSPAPPAGADGGAGAGGGDG